MNPKTSTPEKLIGSSIAFLVLGAILAMGFLYLKYKYANIRLMGPFTSDLYRRKQLFIWSSISSGAIAALLFVIGHTLKRFAQHGGPADALSGRR